MRYTLRNHPFPGNLTGDIPNILSDIFLNKNYISPKVLSSDLYLCDFSKKILEINIKETVIVNFHGVISFGLNYFSTRFGYVQFNENPTKHLDSRP